MFSTRKHKLYKQIARNPRINNPKALAEQITQKHSELQVKYDNHTFYFNNDGSALYHIINSIDKIEKLAKSVFEECNVHQRKELCTFFDVGANIGLFTVFVKDYFPDAIVHVFEADSQLLPYIEKNINGLKNVHIHNLAVSDKHRDRLSFYRNNNSLQTNSLFKEAVQPFAKSIDEFEVESCSLDGFAEDNGIEKVDLIKVDIQGAEYIALKSGTRTLANCSFLLLEVCFLMPNAIESLKLAYDFFPMYYPINDVLMGVDIIMYKNSLTKKADD